MFSFLHVLSSFFSLRYCSSHASRSKEFATKRTATSAVTTKLEVCLKWAGTNQMTTKGTVENAHKFSLISSFGFNVFSLVVLYVIFYMLFHPISSSNISFNHDPWNSIQNAVPGQSYCPKFSRTKSGYTLAWNSKLGEYKIADFLRFVSSTRPIIL